MADLYVNKVTGAFVKLLSQENGTVKYVDADGSAYEGQETFFFATHREPSLDERAGGDGSPIEWIEGDQG